MEGPVQSGTIMTLHHINAECSFAMQYTNRGIQNLQILISLKGYAINLEHNTPKNRISFVFELRASEAIKSNNRILRLV